MINIKQVRQSKKITQAKLAKKCGLSQAYINELENGIKKNPSIEVLEKISQALSVSVSALLEGDESQSFIA